MVCLDLCHTALVSALISEVGVATRFGAALVGVLPADVLAAGVHSAGELTTGVPPVGVLPATDWAPSSVLSDSGSDIGCRSARFHLTALSVLLVETR